LESDRTGKYRFKPVQSLAIALQQNRAGQQGRLTLKRTHMQCLGAEAPLSRRTVLKQLTGVTAVALAPNALASIDPMPSIRISEEKLAHIPADFIGLSYESSQLTHPTFFSSSNHTLVQFFRTLDDHGVLRLGGNMSEYTVWNPDAPPEGSPGETEGPDPGFGTDRVFTITPHAIDNLATFLDATQWRLIYGLNLARGTAESAVKEAKYVTNVMGSRLIALQFGNEPDLFKHPDQSKWTYEEFIAKWNDFYVAVRAALPDVPIAGPDTSNPKWNIRFVDDVGHKVVLQTSHFYAEGPPTDARMNIDYLLHPGPHQQGYVTQAVDVAKRSGMPYRMAEGNTCYASGKAGVSDTFASALWVVDFMMAIAQSGGVGVNLHGGGSGLYTPIAGSMREGYTARPIYYGMLMVKQLLGNTVLRVDVETAGKNVTAYAAQTEHALQVIVINKEARPVALRVAAPAMRVSSKAFLWRLKAPSITSTTGVTWASASVKPDGHFHTGTPETLRLNGDSAALELGAYSAALVTFSIKKGDDA
jgi:hypothetical protein